MEFQDLRLFQLFNLLSPKELNRLTLFIGSPYFNQQQPTRDLFQILRNYSESARLDELTREHLFEQLFPGEAFHWQKLKDRMSYLAQLITQFWVHEKLQHAPVNADIMLLEVLAKKGAEKLFSQYQKSTIKKIEKRKDQYVDYHFQLAEVSKFEDQLKALGKKREYGQGLQASADHLNLYFLIKKLQQCCEMLNRNHIQQEPYEPNLMSEVLEIIEKRPHLQEHPAVAAWYAILNSLLFPDQDYWLEVLQAALIQHEKAFSAESLHTMYKYALNFCIRKINAGEANYLKKSFELYQYMLEQKILQLRGSLSHTDFKNVVTTGIRLKAFEWVESFIENYRAEVDAPYAENVYAYCKAYLYAESGQVRAAIRLLRDLAFTDVYYELSARNLLLKIYYDEGEMEALRYQLKSYRLFLQRNRTISARNRSSYLNFGRFLQKLLRLSERSFILKKEALDKEKSQLQQHLSSTQNIAQRSWLLERLKKISN